MRVQRINPAFERVLGYTLQDIPDIESWWSLAYPDVAYRMEIKAEWIRRTENAVRESNHFIEPLEVRVRTKNGSFTYLEIGATKLPRGMLVIFTDISKRKQIEERLKESEERARLATESAKIGTWDWNLADQTVVMSPREYQLLGLEPRDQRENVDIFFSRIHPDDQESMNAVIEKSIATGEPFEQEFRITLPTGQIRWMHGAGCAYRDQPSAKVTRMAGINLDITDRKLHSENIQNNQMRLFGIINSAMDGIITIDHEHKIIVFNAAAEKMFRCSTADAIGKSIDRFLPERFRANHGKHIQQFVRDGTSTRSMGRFGAISGLRQNGEEFPLEASISQIVIDGLLMLTVTLRDATERQNAEKTKSELESQLRQAQKLESIGTLAGGIAHDFNNILGIVVGNAEMLESEIDEKSRGRIHLERILKAAERATKVIQQILTFSRQQKEPLREKFILDAAISETLALLRASIPTSVEIRAQLSSRNSCVLGDPTQIHQIIMNLITNAWQAMPNRIGWVQIETALELHSNSFVMGDSNLPAGDYIHCIVRDNGKGIPEDDLSRVFDPFFTTKAPGEGTGLGLAVVHGIVRSNGGAISVKSDVGLGTEFRVYFPVHRGATESLTTYTDQKVHSGGGKHIVVVDDEPDLVEVTREMLEQMGFRVSTFVDPRSALEFICTRDQRIDLVISDMTMPHMTGIELLEAIRKQSETIPMLLVTGFTYVIPEEVLRRTGAVEVLLKPLKRNALKEALGQILTRSRES